MYIEDNGATLNSNSNIPKRHQSRPTQIPSQIQQISQPPPPPPPPASVNGNNNNNNNNNIINNRLSNNNMQSDVNNYNNAALEPIDENRPRRKDDKNQFRAADGKV